MAKSGGPAHLRNRLRDALIERLEQSQTPTSVSSSPAYRRALPASSFAEQRASRPSSQASSVQPARSISFGAELVRAILAGTKTQTRRAVRPQPPNRPAVADCPLGQVGDVLYVREPWRAVTSHRYQYAADGPAQVKYRAAMYMPRAASRLSIQIDRVRAQRLHAITPADILAEGCEIAEGLSSRRAFAALWNRFYPPGVQWTDNPWVWVLHFHLITPS